MIILKKYKFVFIEFITAVLIFSFCFNYYNQTARSGAWFYDSYDTAAKYKIGKIDFLFYDDKDQNDSKIPVKLYAKAPTRYYELDEYNDLKILKPLKNTYLVFSYFLLQTVLS